MNEHQAELAERIEPAHGSPGQAIREARERAGISIEELGSRTRLTRETLEAMEGDRFEDLLEPVYVRGYYRKCARVLEIPESPLVKAYDALYRPPPVVTPSRLRLAPSGDLNPRSRAPSRVLLAVPIILILIAAVVWMMRQGPASTELGQSITLIDPDNPNIIISDTMPPIGNETSSVDEVEPVTAVAPVSSISDGSPQLPEVVPAVPAGPVGTTLQLEFNSLSWARIEDATGKSLLSGVIASGETKVLDGKPPYSVFLGNAPGVTVKFGGIDIDVSPHTKANSTARFSVPAAGS